MCFTLHVVVVVVARGCLYKMSWPAFPSGSGYFLFPHKMCVVFIYTVFPVPLGEIHLGDVSEAHRK